jgi:hypothetical protein
MTVSHNSAVAYAAAKVGQTDGGGANGYGKTKRSAVNAYSTVALSSFSLRNFSPA